MGWIVENDARFVSRKYLESIEKTFYAWELYNGPDEVACSEETTDGEFYWGLLNWLNAAMNLPIEEEEEVDSD